MDRIALKVCVYGNAMVAIGLAIYFFIIPFFILLDDINDPALRNGDIPDFIYRLHKNLSPKIDEWAQGRVRDGSGAELSVHNISGTEWPMFSAVYYLWGTEALVADLKLKDADRAAEVLGYSTKAIDSAVELIIDPQNAHWVIQHWGDEYLSRENVFYRMLLIAGLTSYQSLSGNDQYETLLREQALSLSVELNESKFGLLDDYPGECYPVDILPAIAVIARSGKLIDHDFSDFVSKAKRGFIEKVVDPQTNLPAYRCDSETGMGIGSARGVGISYMLIWASEIWPDLAERWYELYERHFWKTSPYVSGFREYPNPINMTAGDVDAGPIVAGYGTAASAFGIGATKRMAKFYQSAALGAQGLVVSWPLSDGSLLNPRLLSNLADAPYIGETALLFSYTRTPVSGIDASPFGGRYPFLVHIGVSVYMVTGLLFIWATIRGLQTKLSEEVLGGSKLTRVRFCIWLSLLLSGAVLLFSGLTFAGILLFLFAQLVPLNSST